MRFIALITLGEGVRAGAEARAHCKGPVDIIKDSPADFTGHHSQYL